MAKTRAVMIAEAKGKLELAIAEAERLAQELISVVHVLRRLNRTPPQRQSDRMRAVKRRVMKGRKQRFLRRLKTDH